VEFVGDVLYVSGYLWFGCLIVIDACSLILLNMYLCVWSLFYGLWSYVLLLRGCVLMFIMCEGGCVMCMVMHSL